MSSQPSSKPFQIAFIGSGAVAQRHMGHLKNLPGVQIAGAADVSEWWLDKTKTDHAIPRLFKDYRVMLDELPEIEAVSVCTPNALHAEHAIAALHRGKHVLVEKPMAISAAQCRQMLEAARSAGKQLIVGFQYRFDPKTRVLKDQIASGRFGKILYIRAQWLRRRGIPSWGQFGRKDLQGGGPMMDLGVHLLDIAHYLLGAPRPTRVSGAAFTCIGNQCPSAAAPWGPWDHTSYSVEDLAVGSVRFDSGAMLSIETSFAAHIEQDEMNVTIVGEKAGASWKDSKIFQDVGGYMMTSQAQFLGNWDAFEYKMRHFVEVCRDGRPNEIPTEHAVQIQQIVDALYASAETGLEVAI